MCQAIRFTIHNQSITVNFADPNPCVPVLMRNGNLQIIPWGNPSKIHSFFPPGSTVHINDLRLDKLRYFHPRAVSILCQAYMLLDENNHERWFDLETQNKHGLKAITTRVNDKDRVYIVVRSAELLDHGGFNQWPIPTFINDKTHIKDRK